MTFDTTQQAYQDLRNIFAEKSDSIVAWVGAGVSRPAGLPSWSELRSRLLDELERIGNAMTDLESRQEKLDGFRLASEEKDYWKSFSILKNKMGRETYKAAIRRPFNRVEELAVPEVYRHLWRLGVSGMINLNIDRLANRAFSEVFETKAVTDFCGKRAGEFMHLLRVNKPWLANLHGDYNEFSSWVFTSQELNSLFQDAGYDQFVKACFATRTVVFFGISADDIAAGEHLRQLTSKGVDCGGHYWVTHDQSKREWAESAGIRLISYSDGNDHAELLELFEDLNGFLPSELPAKPVVLNAQIDAESLPSKEELESKSAPEIRKILNAHASGILKETSAESVQQFEDFANEYSEAIYRAWYVDTLPPKNELLGYELTEECKEGAFGTVYRATNGTGKQFAVKVLHEKVRKSREMLQSFRRGVASMRILTNDGVNGVVNYHDASEIPAVVVMDYIEGIDLVEATRMRVLEDWRYLIETCRRLTEIIRSSHRLPQRVLHRDIRPSNVMLENCWGPNPDWANVKLWVLDFDLSHHLDSFDVSISSPGQANGFLAPEQVERNSGVSTRNALVDSFGLGMTFYYLRTGAEPRFGEHRYGNWDETLRGCAHNYPCEAWHSLPARFSRLIFRATLDRQEERWEVANIENELLMLEEALLKPQSVRSSELLAEELAARGFRKSYTWDSESLRASHQIGNIRVSISGDEKEQKVFFRFEWLQQGKTHHQRLKKWLPAARARVEALLRKAGWKTNVSLGTGQLSGDASIDSRLVKTYLAKQANAVSESIEALNFA